MALPETSKMQCLPCPTKTGMSLPGPCLHSPKHLPSRNPNVPPGGNPGTQGSLADSTPAVPRLHILLLLPRTCHTGRGPHSGGWHSRVGCIGDRYLHPGAGGVQWAWLRSAALPGGPCAGRMEPSATWAAAFLHSPKVT